MKKKLLAVLLMLISLMLSGCGDNRQSVEIMHGRFVWAVIKLDIRSGYEIAENAYSIVETEIGYDIVVHARKTQQEPTKEE